MKNCAATATATTSNNKNILLAIDVGSSSVRCIAYHHHFGTTTTTTKKNAQAIDVAPITGCSASISRHGVEPTTGIVRTKELMEAVDSAVDEVLSKLRARFRHDDDESNPPRVQAVGFSTFAMNLVAVDDRGELIPFDQDDDDVSRTIGISYACNAPEVHADCQSLRDELGPEALDQLYQATGAPLHSAYALPQLRVLYKGNRNGLKELHTHRWQSIAGHCLSRWTNRKHLPITFSEASWTGLLNVRACVWEESAIQALPQCCRDALPELVDFQEYVLGITQFLDNRNNNTNTNPYWTRFPELRNAKFFLGIGDGACANVGSKCTTPSRVAVTVGTSAAVRMCLRHPASSSSDVPLPFRIPDCRGLFCYRIDRNHVLVGGALTDGGSIVDWAKRFLNLETDRSAFEKCLDETRQLVQAECQQQQQDLPTNTTGKHRQQHRSLIMAPFLSGERSTGFRDGAAGAVFGFTRETTRAHFFKSCLEGVSLRLRAVIELLLLVVDNERRNDGENTMDNSNNSSSTPLPVMVASGKAMEVNHLWRQMIADSCGLRVVLDEDTTEGTSRGVARLVALSLLAETNQAATGKDAQPISLDLAQHEEELHPFLTSEPRSIATALYAKKACKQESFIDSITPFFSSS